MVDPRVFTDLRAQALHASRESLSLAAPSSPTTPWGVLMETGYPEATATVVAFADGSASIYLSTGGGFIGGMSHETVRRAAIDMVRSAGSAQPHTNKTNTLPLPAQGQVVFYLHTDAGVFTGGASEQELGTRRHPLSSLFFAGHELITQYRLLHERGELTRPARPFQRPTPVERLLNRAIGALVSLGLGPAHMRVLEVRGRKSGKRYALPVDLLDERGRLYLVAPRGYTEWVRNAEVAGEVTLRRGRRAQRYRLRALSEPERPPILKAYLDRFRREVQRYFPVPAGSPAAAFAPHVARYPAFELTRTEAPASR
jgi:deazaflavin-dependent oxidoreductase (nitroreductase family)